MSQPVAGASAPILQVRGLTLRFGGLTAVSDVHLAVQRGEIAAVIGPNGAGKTSLFNAITGIYEPTEGTVEVCGRDVQSQLTTRHKLRFAAAGMFLGLLALLSASNLDGLWLATVKAQPAAAFSVGTAVRDAGRYLLAEPRMENRLGRVTVVSWDGHIPLANEADLAAATTARDKLAAALSGSAPFVATETGVQAGDTVLASGLSAAKARRLAADLTEARAEQASAMWTRLLAFLVAGVLGAAGTFAVWQRTRRTPHGVAMQGVARTFQNIRLFHHMTVAENVLVAMDRHLRRRVVAGQAPIAATPVDLAIPVGLGALLALVAVLTRLQAGTAAAGLLAVVLAGTAAWLVQIRRRGYMTAAGQQVEAAAQTEALRLLAFVGLGHRAGELAKNLPYGEQRRLEIARALASQPQLLLLDEPAAGMNPSESLDLSQLIRRIADAGTTVLLIEHHMRVVMGISDHITVLVHGKCIAHGSPEQVRNNPKVIEAYLGTDDQH
jgi:ABC-type branched-subunit amino acid transport system ATPase component